jgi:hypothetical protein
MRAMGDKGLDRDGLNRAEIGDVLRTFAEETDRRPPLATVWTVRLMLGVFVALAGFFAFLTSFVIELFLVSLIARPDQLPPIAVVPLFAISAVVTAISVGAVIRRLRRTLGLGS